MRHLGVSSSGQLIWQKSPVTGNGRLTPLWLHLVADIDTGRLMAELDLPSAPNPTGFLERIFKQAATLGGHPQSVLPPKELARTEPRLVAAMQEANVSPKFASNDFKKRQKISRHFEEFLNSLMHSHSLLAERSNLDACWSDLIDAWNSAGQSSEDDLRTRTIAGNRVVEKRLGLDPRSIAREAFREQRLEASDLRLAHGQSPGCYFNDAAGFPIRYSDFDFTFHVSGHSYRVPLFAPFATSSGDLPLTLSNFDPRGIILPATGLPPEFRSSWSDMPFRTDVGIGLVDVLSAMRARGTPVAEISAVLRSMLHAWTAPVSQPRRAALELVNIEPAVGARSSGISFINESWERIRDRHFWQVSAVWDAGWEHPLIVSRVQIERDGRLNILTEHPFFLNSSAGLSESLCTLFLRSPIGAVDPDWLITPLDRKAVVRSLQDRAVIRAAGKT
jgi:hypothetical protein